MGSGSNSWSIGVGGSGAGFNGSIRLKKNSNVKIHVGNGGYGKNNSRGNYGSGNTDGEDSFININNERVITAGGGKKGNYGSGGAGGILTIDESKVDVITSTIRSNGNNGQGGAHGGNSGAYNGAKSVISGHTFGGSGKGSAYSGGGSVEPSINGFCSISYLYPDDLEYSKSGVYYFYVNKLSKYKLTMIGAGGGGCGNGCEYPNQTQSACTGAGGGGIICDVVLPVGVYSVTVGLGGSGASGTDYLGERAGIGGNSIFKTNDNSIIVECSGGQGGRAWYKNNYELGVGGSASYNSSFVSNAQTYNGSNGKCGTDSVTRYICNDTIEDEINGRGGSAYGGILVNGFSLLRYNTGKNHSALMQLNYCYIGENGYDGYFKLEFLSFL